MSVRSFLVQVLVRTCCSNPHSEVLAFRSWRCSSLDLLVWKFFWNAYRKFLYEAPRYTRLFFDDLVIFSSHVLVWGSGIHSVLHIDVLPVPTQMLALQLQTCLTWPVFQCYSGFYLKRWLPTLHTVLPVFCFFSGPCGSRSLACLQGMP